ncbi:MAG: DUF5317 domain-containing protein [Firmicutes bacterium]|nr:DUF5317 domain-containing protein [Bacillota bacterium]
MLIVEAFILSIIVALLRGGELSGLARVRLRSAWLAFAPLAVQLAVFLFEPVRFQLREAIPYLHALTYVFAGAFVLANANVPGMKIMGLGAASNALVITANGGYMPASSAALTGAGMIPVLQALASGPHHNSVLIDGRTVLWFLGDIFYVPPPFPTPNVFSVGDVLIAAGCFLFVQAATGKALLGCDGRKSSAL